jgi:hypothetical protein
MILFKKKQSVTGYVSHIIEDAQRRPVRRVTGWPDGSPQTDIYLWYDEKGLAAVHKMMFSRNGRLSVEIFYGRKMEVRMVRAAINGVEVSRLYAYFMRHLWRAL